MFIMCNIIELIEFKNFMIVIKWKRIGVKRNNILLVYSYYNFFLFFEYYLK